VTALRANGVSRAFEGVAALQDVDLDVRRHEIVGLIGPNGAGKTTLVNCITGFDLPDAGAVTLDEREVTRWPVARRARAGLARTFQITNLLPALTVAENLALAVQSESRWRWDPVRPWRRHRATWRSVDELLERARLTDVRDSLVGSLPYGHQRRLEIIVAVARPSSVILLDEPGAGLSSEETEELMLLVFGLNPELAVMFIDHDVNLALRLATRVTVLHLGRVVAEGTPDEIRRRGPLDDIYLGAPAGA
jgi:branched-chain amino acid transport system ATP-binding protein